MEDQTSPQRRPPLAIVSFDGWSDAGGAATGVLAHLTEVWDAELLMEIDAEKYFDYQVNRPRVLRPEGSPELDWPSVRMLHATGAPPERDVILIEGVEPSFRWRAFAKDVLRSLERLGVAEMITLGALLADVPHTRPFTARTTSEDAQLRRTHALDRSTYQGHIGALTVLGHRASERGLSVMSSWVAVPHYAAAPPSPKASLALLAEVSRLIGTPIPLGSMPAEASDWVTMINELAEADDEITRYIAGLEATQDDEPPLVSGDTLAREFENYLRAHESDEREDPPAQS